MPFFLQRRYSLFLCPGVVFRLPTWQTFCTARCPLLPNNHARFLSRPESFSHQNICSMFLQLCGVFPQPTTLLFVWPVDIYLQQTSHRFALSCAFYPPTTPSFFVLHGAVFPKQPCTLFSSLMPSSDAPQQTNMLASFFNCPPPTNSVPFYAAERRFSPNNISRFLCAPETFSPRNLLPHSPTFWCFSSTNAVPLCPAGCRFPPINISPFCSALFRFSAKQLCRFFHGTVPFSPYNHARFLSRPELFFLKIGSPFVMLCAVLTQPTTPQFVWRIVVFPKPTSVTSCPARCRFLHNKLLFFVQPGAVSAQQLCTVFVWRKAVFYPTLRRLLCRHESFSQKKTQLYFSPGFSCFPTNMSPNFYPAQCRLFLNNYAPFCVIRSHFPQRISFVILTLSAVSPHPTLSLFVGTVVDFPPSTSFRFLPLCCVFPPNNSAVICTARCPFPPCNYALFLPVIESFSPKNRLPLCHALCCSHTTNCTPICLANCRFSQRNHGYFLSATVTFNPEQLRHFSYDLVPFPPNNCARF
ncbi:hypothetical protein T10_10608 [Trichinella papuae]|uniref:Uncharacterized protein n=1 Tax=Trichinella papuae TaxID=268474 RepID=A0A0V1M487_9BILA|nr:hypothetical protein T10_10608 [Trichinella papuae]